MSRHLTVHGDRLYLLAPMSLELFPGELVAVAGPSGSGKTTLCNIVIGWDRADTGRVEWAESGPPAWSRCSVAPQRLALLPQLTVRENIMVPVWADRAMPTDRIYELAGNLQIDGLLGRLPADISFGEQQRAAIARALVTLPAVAILDEPTGHQDVARTQLVIDALLDDAGAARVWWQPRTMSI